MLVVVRRPDQRTLVQRYRLAIDRQIARTYEERPSGSTRRDIAEVWLEETRRGRQPRQ